MAHTDDSLVHWRFSFQFINVLQRSILLRQLSVIRRHHTSPKSYYRSRDKEGTKMPVPYSTDVITFVSKIAHFHAI